MFTSHSYAYSGKSLWSMLLYFGLSFYCFGAIMMVHYVVYPSLIQENANLRSIMQSFNKGMPAVCYVPQCLLTLSTIVFYWLNKQVFPRWALIASILFAIVVATVTLFFIVPIHADLTVTGLTKATATKLIGWSFNFQVIPATCQFLLSLFLLNKYLQDIRFVGRWLFILVFALSFYDAGLGFIDMFVFYPSWALVNEADWLTYRFIKNKFLEVFLIPTLIPFVLIISLFQFRPKQLPKSLLFIIFFAASSVVISSVFYFVPKIQIPLNKKYSLDLINDLMLYSFLLWLPAILLMVFIAARMLLVIKKPLHSEKK